MRAAQYREAEAAFVAALSSLEAPRRSDVRVQTTLGNLVRLASIYRRLDRNEDADRVIAFVSEFASEYASDDAHDAPTSEAYRVRYQILSEQTLEFAYQPFDAFADEPYAFEPSVEGLIKRTARKYQVDPHLVKAVVAAESNFDVLAVSEKGAQGLMQLMPATAREMGVRAPFKPSENLKGGVRYLRSLLDRYANLGDAIAAYNAGPVAVDRYGGIPPYPETQAYVERVLRYYHEYRDEIGP
ncbi:MAG: lytic transglycosylase domain-containing protein [Deltaproteobacteria bacterium]|nr:lytic transglycosylase domain-containing protein [Deltaproteobacteria bacterium]MBW2386992.1 lytic transglycosylase domain-containing protein [Deltaproteobacteria bacterium]